MNHKWLSIVEKVVYGLILMLVQVAIAGFVFYLAFSFLLSVAEAILGFLGVIAPSFWLKLMVTGGMFLVLTVAIAGMVATSGVRLDGDMARTVNNFLYWVAEGHLSEAYHLTSEAFQARMPKLPFLKFAQTELPQQYKKAVWVSRLTEANHGTLKGIIHTQTGETIPIEVELVQENGFWRIDKLHTPSGIGQTALDSTVASAPLIPLPEILTQAAPSDVPQALQERLFQMMSGDRAAAQRLLTHARSKHPGHMEMWYWEKVIEDLERDRT
ncbi:hypothetical protein H6G89_12970 [Oscillatoria sp. FACHB-1407]|uniref:hypothetical protein n=1 Tax=Oscillatoria sp. FACHB-1407 TaxID=2692847 RepID=UPI0016824EBE|nr:hypothetical protein [Oscillatoria sp. FACHB-1407]MBD2461959.1 hypothetical protein [Oscillatoria sp. FACHB-1407]